MNTQYDAIAAQYVRTKSSPLRAWVERPSLLGLVGEIAGQRVLDLACGDGFYTRELRAAGLEHHFGVRNRNRDIAIFAIDQAARFADRLARDDHTFQLLGAFGRVDLR